MGKHKTFPPKITMKAARVNAGYNQDEAAKRLGIHVSTLIQWEKNPGMVKSGYLIKIAEVYNYPTDFIFFNIDTSLNC